MDEDIVEGEVIDSYDPRQDPRIAFEVEDFQQYMDEMKQAYLFAADMISHAPYYRPPKPHVSEMPGNNRVVVRICGKVLIATGQWLLSKSPGLPNSSPGAEKEEDWAWADQASYEQPTALPLPELHRIRSL